MPPFLGQERHYTYTERLLGVKTQRIIPGHEFCSFQKPSLQDPFWLRMCTSGEDPETNQPGWDKRRWQRPRKLPPYKGFQLPKGATLLSSSVCLSASIYLFNKLFTLVLTFCLLIWIRSWLERQGLRAPALTVGFCGPAISTSGLGN